MDVVAQPDQDARRAIEQRLADILDAVHTGDLQRLAGYHLDSPTFTKFNDSPPLERQDFATAMAAEAAEFEALDGIRGAYEDVRIDLFGAVAVVTGIFAYQASAGDERFSGRIRMTAVMVEAGGWKIAHEHLSEFPDAAGPST